MNEFAPLPALRLLHLEDNPRDHALVREILHVHNFECDIQHVQTKEDFQQALEESAFDVILSDLTLPGFNGMDALAATDVQPT